MNSPIQPPRRRQNGAALVIVLILLLVMTILGLATLRGAIMEERMSANLFDRGLAFQSAEIGLRDAEQTILAGGIGAATDCRYGSAASTQAACVPTPADAFDGSGVVTWTNAAHGQATGVTAGLPQYYVQYMGERSTNEELGIPDDPNYGSGSGIATAEYYRVTARSNNPSTAAGQARAVTVLQSTVVRE